MRKSLGDERWDMLGRRTCRDMRGYAGRYWKDEVGYDGRGICGTDHLPEIGPAVLPFLAPSPPIHEGRQMGAENNQRSEKRMLIFNLNC